MREKCWKRWSFVSEGQQLLTLVELQSLLLAVCVCVCMCVCVCVCVRACVRERENKTLTECKN